MRLRFIAFTLAAYTLSLAATAHAQGTSGDADKRPPPPCHDYPPGPPPDANHPPGPPPDANHPPGPPPPDKDSRPPNGPPDGQPPDCGRPPH